MRHGARQIDKALDGIEPSILPGLSGLLDSLIDSASLARPGIDADNYATEIRYAAMQVGALTELVAAVAPSAQPGRASRSISA